MQLGTGTPPQPGMPTARRHLARRACSHRCPCSALAPLPCSNLYYFLLKPLTRTLSLSLHYLPSACVAQQSDILPWNRNRETVQVGSMDLVARGCGRREGGGVRAIHRAGSSAPRIRVPKAAPSPHPSPTTFQPLLFCSLFQLLLPLPLLVYKPT